jgi:phospholipase C
LLSSEFRAISGKLRLSAITPNYFQLKTKFPASVGHTPADVEQQLGERLEMPSGRWINSPHGFVANFLTHVTGGLVPDDVLGYYDAEDLAFYAFLAENYAYSARSFCSHPGPTLPNRMFSLSGDVQYDRTGEAILGNNNGENFSLSRAPTIFDLLTRKGVPWRVYESPPSVTMLRMFARYAGDNTNIVPVSRRADDIAGHNLPAMTFIDPAMHSFPENDDHPPADMYNGQVFLKGIYDTLRADEQLWRKTALIITYDEHGGFFDHVIPPIAEARSRPLVFTGGGPSGAATVHHDDQLRLRVPTFVVSPWVPAGKGPDIILDHCSILKTVLARFCGDSRPFLADRVHAARSFDAYLSASEPRLDVPMSPAMEPLPIGTQSRMYPGSAIDTEPMSRQKMRQGNVDAHELLGMLARMLGR